MTDTMIPPHRDDVPPATRLLGLWLHRSWGIGAVAAIALAAVVVCTLVALPILLSRPAVYGAQADILVNPGVNLSDAATDRALVTQEVILRAGRCSTGAPAPPGSRHTVEQARSNEGRQQEQRSCGSTVPTAKSAPRNGASSFTEEYEQQASWRR